MHCPGTQLQSGGVGVQTQASTSEPGFLPNSRSLGTFLPALPSLPPNHIFWALTMCYARFWFWHHICDQSRHIETISHASSGPITTMIPVFSAHLSIGAGTGLHSFYVLMYQPFIGLWDLWGRSTFVTHLYLASTESDLKLAACLFKAIEWMLLCAIWHPIKLRIVKVPTTSLS